jgi:NHL repeat
MDMNRTPQAQRPRTAEEAVRGPLGRLLLLSALGLLFFTLAPTASAELSICGPGTGPGNPGSAAGKCEDPRGVATDFETGRLYVADAGNNRIDVFESDGTFVMAFGWGVDTGANALQSCTTASKCQAGIPGTGAGQFDSPTWIAVDNDPSSLSQHAVYVGTDSSRVQKFDPAGNFISAFGYDVVAHGANNSANSEEQALTVNASGGTFKLKLENAFSGGPTPLPETAPLPFNASAAEVAAALNSLSTIGGLGGSVTVTGTSPYLIDFEGNLAGDDVPALGTDGNALTGPSPSIGVTEQHRGGALEVCEGEAGEVCKRGSAQPGGQCEISRTSDPIGVGPGGALYVADRYNTGFQIYTNRFFRFGPAGNCLSEVELFKGADTEIRSLAVDSNGNFYATIAGAGGVIRKYDPSGALLYELGKGGEAEGLAVDAADHLFAKQNVQQITKSALVSFVTEYDSSGSILKRFGYRAKRNIPGLAAYQSATGDLYASEEVGGVKYLKLPEGPGLVPEPCRVKEGALGNSKATLLAEVNPEGKATTFHFQYVDEKSFQDEGGFASPNTKVTAESASIGSDFELHEASAVASDGVVPETKYRCRVVATNADGSSTGEEGSFTTLEPLEIGDTTVSGVGSEEATLNATVNPLGIPTTAYFQYVEETTYLKDIADLGPEHGFDHASKAPNVDEAEEPINYGAGEGFKVGSATVTGLKPATAYRFRIVATDELIDPKEIVGEAASFRTYGPGTDVLADNRAWELVSPAQKNSAEVAVPGNSAGFDEPRTIRIQAGATSGETVTYTSWTSFANAEGSSGTNQYLSKRSASGWQTENISPFGFSANPIAPPFTGFTPDLRFGAFKQSEPALSDDCAEGYENFYLRDNESGELACLTPEAPNIPVGGGGCFVFAGASADGSRAFFATPLPYVGAPAGAGFNLYEWSAAEGKLRVVSVLPGESEPVAPTERITFGANAGSGGGGENCQTGLTIMRHVVSADGSRAIWTYKSDDTSKPSRLLVRVNGTETIQLDALPAQKPGPGPAGGGAFRAASTDGSVVYFIDENRLISGSKSEPGKPDLYRYEFGNPTPLTNLTKGTVPGDVRGVVGASDDGSHVYFVAGAALTGEEENGAGQKATEGANNLYLHHGGKTSFIATLAAEGDQGNWREQPRTLGARVAPDGRHLAFLSLAAEALAGYDNTLADETITGGQHCEWDQLPRKFVGSPLCRQAFVYDAEADELTCTSCNPSGSRPLGPTLVPGWTNVYEGPRYLSDDGSRMFFETYDSLVPSDQNGKRDVYQFEFEGSGTCESESPAFDPASGGCHSLVSSGEDTDQSYLVDASADGRDVFFSTRARLTGWDTNDNYDVYDAREGGGFPEPPPPSPVCVGEGCKGPANAPPGTSSPSTPHWQGPGNTKELCPKGKARRKGRCESPRPRCSKGKVNRKGRCVKAGQNRKPQRQRASHNRRAAR